jgi:drug/metabolite transporter (DMT)-like permease
MPWQVALSLYFVVLVSQVVLQRSYSQKSKLPESFPPALSYAIGVLPLGIIVGLTMHPHVQWSWWLIFLLALEGTFIALYNWLSFMSIRRLPIARYQTIYQSYEIVVILLGWTLLSERLTLPQTVGGLFLLAGALLAIHAPKKNDRKPDDHTHTTAILLAAGSAVTIGIGLVAEKAALRHMSMGAYFIFGYATQVLALVALAAKDVNRQTVRTITPYDLHRSLAMGVLSSLIGFFYIAAIVRANNISLITALSTLSLPLSVLAGYIFLREREHTLILWISLGVSFVGLVVSALH